MSAKQMLPQKVVGNTSFYQGIRREVKQEQGKQDGITIPDVAISLSPMAFVFSWVMFLIIVQKLRTVMDNKMVFRLQNSQKVPCKNCQYYSHNNYLKCAVQPSLVMTEKAHDCSEYSRKKGRFSPKNIFGKDNNFN